MPLGRPKKTRWDKLNGTHQLLAYADNVNLLGDNINTRKKNAESLIDAGTEVGLEINVEETKHMLVSGHQNTVQYHDKVCHSLNICNGSNKSEFDPGGN
jgi:hypothetical protein